MQNPTEDKGFSVASISGQIVNRYSAESNELERRENMCNVWWEGGCKQSPFYMLAGKICLVFHE
jgi:hypothetical protein